MKYFLSFLIIFISVNSALYAQIQKGQDIYGVSAAEHCGRAISMPDTCTIAVGAPENSDAANGAGQVRIFSWNGTIWVQKGLEIPGEGIGDQSGDAISMPDSNTIAIGARYNNGNGTWSGQVRVFFWFGLNWLPKGSPIYGDTAGDFAGVSVSMPDPNTIAIGASRNDDNGNMAGQVKVYYWSGFSWVQKGADLNGELADDRFGFSVSMPNSNMLAVGAPFNDGNGNLSGHVRVFTWDGNSWVQKGSDIDGMASGDVSGWSVSMPDTNTIAIGSPENDGNGNDAGQTRVFSWDGIGWSQKGSAIGGLLAGDEFGWSVSMPSATVIAVGGYKNDGGGVNAGHTRVFCWDGSNWVQRGTTLNGDSPEDLSGYSVSMPDNYTLAVGAISHDGGGIPNSGQTKVFRVTPAVYTQQFDTSCNNYHWPQNGMIYNSSGTYSTSGCDTVNDLILTIIPIDTSITDNSPTLIANAAGVSYQWIDCNNGFSPIPGAINRSFTASSSGVYAVIVSGDVCSDTSGCRTINLTSSLNSNHNFSVEIVPNPTHGRFQINSGRVRINSRVLIRNSLGIIVNEQAWNGSKSIELTISQPSGIYFLELMGDDGMKTVHRVVKF